MFREGGGFRNDRGRGAHDTSGKEMLKTQNRVGNGKFGADGAAIVLKMVAEIIQCVDKISMGDVQPSWPLEVLRIKI